MRALPAIILAACLLVPSSAPGAVASWQQRSAGRSDEREQPATPAERAPDLVLLVTDGMQVRKSGLGSLVTTLLDAIESDPPLSQSWVSLASELGYTRDELFDRLLGDRFALVVGADPEAEQGGSAHWAVVSRISEATYQRLRERLKPAPRSIEGDWQLLLLERGRFELAARTAPPDKDAPGSLAEPAPERPSSSQGSGSAGVTAPARVQQQPPARQRAARVGREVEIVFAPAGRTAVFDRVVRGKLALGDDPPEQQEALAGSCRLSQIRKMERFPKRSEVPGPSVHIAARRTALAILTRGASAQSEPDEFDDQAELRVGLVLDPADPSRWLVDSVLTLPGDPTKRESENAGAERTDSDEIGRDEADAHQTACLTDESAMAWSEDAELAVLATGGFSSNRVTAVVGAELLRQMGLGRALSADEHDSELLGLRIDVHHKPSPAVPTPGRNVASKPDVTTVLPPTLSVLLRLTDSGAGVAKADRAIWQIAQAGRGTADPSTAQFAAGLDGFALSAVRTAPLAAASGTAEATALPRLTWSFPNSLPSGLSREEGPSVEGVTPLVCVSLTPAGEASAGTPIGSLHRALRSACHPAAKPFQHAVLRWLVSVRPAMLEASWPADLTAWEKLRVLMRQIERVELRFESDPGSPDTPDLWPAIVGNGFVRFAPTRETGSLTPAPPTPPTPPPPTPAPSQRAR